MLRTRASIPALVAAAAIVGLAPAGAPAASGAHTCRQGDPPLLASARTSCSLAGRITTDFVTVCHQSTSCRMGVSDPQAGRRYAIDCARTGRRYTGTVRCDAPDGAGIWTRFSSDL